MIIKDFFIFSVIFSLLNIVNGLTRQQLENSGKMFRKNCLAKTGASEDLIKDFGKGKFPEDPKVMCYVACVYQMTNIVKNNKLNVESAAKQVDIMYPPEMKEPTKASIMACKDVQKKYNDLCAASFWTMQCIYKDNPGNFIFA